MYEGNYEALANAIIKQAVKDFRPAYRRLKNRTMEERRLLSGRSQSSSVHSSSKR